MLTIKPAAPERARQLCEENAFPWGDGVLACEACSAGAALGWALFCLEGGVCTVLEAQCDDFLLDGLVRAGLNAADLRGVGQFTVSGRMAAHWGPRLMDLGYPMGTEKIADFFARECPGAR